MVQTIRFGVTSLCVDFPTPSEILPNIGVIMNKKTLFIKVIVAGSIFTAVCLADVALFLRYRLKHVARYSCFPSFP